MSRGWQMFRQDFDPVFTHCATRPSLDTLDTLDTALNTCIGVQLTYLWQAHMFVSVCFCMCECCPARALSLFANSQLETATCKNICVAQFDFLYFLHFHFDFVFSLFLFLIAAVDAFQMSWFMATFRLCSDWLTAWMTDWLSSLTGCSPVCLSDRLSQCMNEGLLMLWQLQKLASSGPASSQVPVTC